MSLLESQNRTLIQENHHLQQNIAAIREKFGTEAQIQDAFQLATLKDQNVHDLLQDLDNNIKSTENQLSCYKCSNVLQDPVLQFPCCHALCKNCVKKGQCLQCDKATKGHVEVDMIKDLANKFIINKDKIETFKKAFEAKSKLH